MDELKTTNITGRVARVEGKTVDVEFGADMPLTLLDLSTTIGGRTIPLQSAENIGLHTIRFITVDDLAGVIPGVQVNAVLGAGVARESIVYTGILDDPEYLGHPLAGLVKTASEPPAAQMFNPSDYPDLKPLTYRDVEPAEPGQQKPFWKRVLPGF